MSGERPWRLALTLTRVPGAALAVDEAATSIAIPGWQGQKRITEIEVLHEGDALPNTESGLGAHTFGDLNRAVYNSLAQVVITRGTAMAWTLDDR